MIKLEEGEHIIKIVRRHYFVMLTSLVTVSLVAVLPLVLLEMIMSGFIPVEGNLGTILTDALSEWKFFAYSLWLLLLWIAFFIEWTDYYLDVWIITDRRIVDVEQKGFFNREVTSFLYRNIQDITVETRGLIPTLLNFGTLHVQTAGQHREILIRSAACPEDVRSTILALQGKENSAPRV